MCLKILIISFFLIQVYDCINYETRLVLDEVTSCPGLPLEEFDMRDLHLKYVDGQSLVYGKVIVRGKTIEPNKLVGLVILEKCRTRNSLSTCEKLFDFFIPKPCKALNSTEEVWSNIIHKMTPPFQCPIQGVDYTMDGGFIDGEVLKKVLPDAEKYFWRIYIKGFDRNEIRFCFRISAGYEKIANISSSEN